jgi:hypothetical protein
VRDPLAGFDWLRLDERYDALCARFDPAVGHLKAFTRAPQSDRDLYDQIVRAVNASPDGRPRLSIDLYEALLYWKLYSQPAAVANLRGWLAPETRLTEAERLARLVGDLPPHVPRNEAEIISLVKHLGIYRLAGMRTETSLPVRSTLLHFLFPDVVPIFDRMVLQAVGVSDRGANQKLDVFREYLPFAWTLADRHTANPPRERSETRIRLIDMALWVVRGTGTKAKGA